MGKLITREIFSLTSFPTREFPFTNTTELNNEPDISGSYEYIIQITKCPADNIVNWDPIPSAVLGVGRQCINHVGEEKSNRNEKVKRVRYMV